MDERKVDSEIRDKAYCHWRERKNETKVDREIRDKAYCRWRERMDERLVDREIRDNLPMTWKDGREKGWQRDQRQNLVPLTWADGRERGWREIRDKACAADLQKSWKRRVSLCDFDQNRVLHNQIIRPIHCEYLIHEYVSGIFLFAADLQFGIH